MKKSGSHLKNESLYCLSSKVYIVGSFLKWYKQKFKDSKIWSSKFKCSIETVSKIIIVKMHNLNRTRMLKNSLCVLYDKLLRLKI